MKKLIFLVLLICPFILGQPSNTIPRRVDTLETNVDSLFTLLDSLSLETDTLIYRNLYAVSVEEYGAVGDGITNDSAAIYNAIKENPDKIISFVNQYNLGGKIHIDASDENIYLKFNEGAKLISTITDSKGNIYYPDAIFRITNAKNVMIDGLYIEAENEGLTPGLTYVDTAIVFTDDTANFLCAFKIDSVENVYLNNVRASDAIYAGIYMSDIDNLQANNCVADSNYYAGMLIRRTKHSVINGGEFSNNGIRMSFGGQPYSAGYGLEFGNAFSPTYGRFNEEITVTGVKAFYNISSGIGAHQAYNYIVIGNHIKGFGTIGINGVSNGYELYVKDVIISNNIIEQDSSWYINNSLTHTLYAGIQVGCYADVNNQVDYPVGNIIISENNLKNLKTSYCINGIQSFVSYTNNIQIINNIISNSTFTKQPIGLYGGNTEGGQPKNVLISGNTLSDITIDGAIDNNESGIFIIAGEQIIISNNIMNGIIADDTLNAGIKVFEYGPDADINTVKVSNNLIEGTLRNGIYCPSGIESVTINNNLLDGTYTDYYIYTDVNSQQLVKDNFVKDLYIIEGQTIPQGNLLPNILGNGTGDMTYTVQTGDSTFVTLNALTLDMLRYENISAVFNIRVHIASFSNIINGYVDYYAYAGNADSVTAYGVDTLEAITYIDISADSLTDFCPLIEWTTIGNEATLKFTFPSAYVGYKVDINFNSWLAVIYKKPE